MQPDKSIPAPDAQVAAVVDTVCETHAAVTITSPKGNAVRVIPVPKPIGQRNGTPIYRAEDIQFIFLEHPYWFERNA